MVRRNIMGMRGAARDGKDMCKVEFCRGCEREYYRPADPGHAVHKVETAYAGMSAIEEYVDGMQEQQEGGMTS